MSIYLQRSGQNARHIPVMLDEALAALAPCDGGTYVDGTFGLGSYTCAILEAADTTVWAIDRDPEAIRRGATLIEEYDPRLTLLQGRFGEMSNLLGGAGIEKGRARPRLAKIPSDPCSIGPFRKVNDQSSGPRPPPCCFSK